MMDLRELQSINKYKNRFTVLFILDMLMALVFISCLVISALADKVGSCIAIAFLFSTVALVILIIGFFSLNKAMDSLLSYVLSQFPDWKKESKTNKPNYDLKADLLLNKNLLLSILPVYKKKQELRIMNNFFNDLKSISTIYYSEYEKHTHKDEDGRIKTSHEYTYEFEAPLIAVKNTKNLNSITYFQTNNYPQKTDKEIMNETSTLALPKTDLPNTAEFNIDAYTNNTNVAEKLATKELFSTMQNIKEQFNLFYVKAVFGNDYIFFILRGKNRNSFKWIFPLYITIPWFKSIDYPLLDKAVNNFKLLTDLANQAPEFTKNI